MTLDLATVKSPIGEWLLIAHETRVVALGMVEEMPELLAGLMSRFGAFETRRHRDPAGAVTAWTRYFGGDVSAFDSLDVDGGGTPFQRRVWRALRAIPAGTTTSYAALARRLGKPNAARAVGHANAVNPVGIIVPCHRVIGADGTLCGYAHGLDRKQWLLDHEARHSATRRSRPVARAMATA